MTAILVSQRSIYDCNLGFVEVQIWVQSWLQKGPNMSAIFIGRAQIWVQTRKLPRRTFQCLQSYLFPNRKDVKQYSAVFHLIRYWSSFVYDNLKWTFHRFLICYHFANPLLTLLINAVIIHFFLYNWE